MTAADYKALGAEVQEDIQQVHGMTDQVRLIGLTASADTFGLPECDVHLIAKLRNMDPELLQTIRPMKED